MNAPARTAIRVSVVYAEPRREIALELTLADGATVDDAIDAARASIVAECGDASWVAAGVHGRRVTGAQALVDGDRVELYRALRCDPKTARVSKAARVARAKQEKR